MCARPLVGAVMTFHRSILLQSPEYKQARQQRQQHTLKQANITRCAVTHLFDGFDGQNDEHKQCWVLRHRCLLSSVLRMGKVSHDITAFSATPLHSVYIISRKVVLSESYTLEPVLKHLRFQGCLHYRCYVNKRAKLHRSAAFDRKTCDQNF